MRFLTALFRSGVQVPLSAKIGDAIQDYQDLEVQEAKEGRYVPMSKCICENSLESPLDREMSVIYILHLCVCPFLRTPKAHHLRNFP